jgi:predicted ATP-grasp superfamily ATP-dependent carboligase
MIYLFTKDWIGTGTLLCLYERLTDLGYLVKVVRNITNIDLESNIVIPMDSCTNYMVFGNRDAEKYKMLDDKIDFYDYLKWNQDLLGDIKLVQTYNNLYKGPNVKRKFIVKDRNGHGSIYNKIVVDKINSVLANYPEYQIQDFIEAELLIAVDGFCRQGKIQHIFYSTQQCIKSFNDYKSLGFPMTYTNTISDKNIADFLYNLLERLDYTGFFQFEFIQSRKEFYILECNPRISGHVLTKNYFDHVILPYIKQGKISEELIVGKDEFPPLVQEIPRIIKKLFCKMFSCTV